MALDVAKFTNHLRAAAKKNSQAKCALRVREALEAGGATISGVRPAHAKNWGATLLRMGFRELRVERPETFAFEAGDVVVLQPYAGGNNSGHIAAYDGVAWISDFVQRDFWSGPGYRKGKPSRVFYRP